MSRHTLAGLMQYKESPDMPYIGDLINRSGIMQTMSWVPANQGSIHKYTVANELPSQESNVAVNGGIVPTTADNRVEIEQVRDYYQEEVASLSAIKDYGDPNTYFRRNAGKFVEKIQQDMISDVIARCVSNATDNSHVVDTGGTAAGAETIILMVRWENDVCSALYNPNVTANGMVGLRQVNGGNIYNAPASDYATSGKVVPSYGVLYESSMGILTKSTKNIAIIKNVKDATGFLPTIDDLDQAFEYVEGDLSGNTFIYCNYLGWRLLNRIKNAVVRYKPEDPMLASMVGDYSG